MSASSSDRSPIRWRSWAGLASGPVLAAVLWLAPPLGTLTVPAQRVAGLASWMAVWWLTGVVPLPATSLLPLAVLPILGVVPARDVAREYADPVIFLFLGGFFIAAATQRWGLHRRFALGIIALVGASARRVLFAFMLATAFLSMWISNTATAAMMLPIAVAVLDLARRESGTAAPAFGTALMLGVAYAASIGGVATLIGTPPNAIFAANTALVREAPIGFAEWMALGLPVATVMLILCWLILALGLYRIRGPLAGVGRMIDVEREKLGTWSTGERATAVVFTGAALAWMLRQPKTIGDLTVPGLATLFPGLTDAGIAIAAAVVLFAVPVSTTARHFVLDWETAARVPWGVLLLFGGGLALASAIDGSGLAAWIGERLAVLAGAPPVVIVGAVAVLFIFLTELTSNTATAAMGMPVMAALAPALGAEPLSLMATVALASSLAFMLPVATPPNAMVFGSGAVPAAQMARAGLWVNLAGVVVITVIMLAVGI